jgi:two-component system NtrC family sensor kinase
METGLPRRLDVTLNRPGDEPDVYISILIDQLKNPETGEAMGGLLLAEDVTSRTSMERRLAVSERLAAVGKLAARVAHELNNPLDGILRYTNLALRLTDPQQQSANATPEALLQKLREYLENTKSGITRMAEITSALLKFSRNAPAAFEQATINKIVEDAVSAMEGRTSESNITVICNFLRSDMPVVRGSNIFQVFCNLIKNAVDAMPDGGTLAVTTSIQDGDIMVVFEDTGIGLPKDAAKIFEPFFTTKAPGKGTGLGLAVCKEMIEKYSGTITAASRESGGAAFTVRIPVRSLETPPIGVPELRDELQESSADG